jgi:hypothetical protein
MNNSIVRSSELFGPVSSAGVHSFSSPILSRTTEGSRVTAIITILIIGVATSLGEHISRDFDALAGGQSSFKARRSGRRLRSNQLVFFSVSAFSLVVPFVTFTSLRDQPDVVSILLFYSSVEGSLSGRGRAASKASES